MLRGILLQTVVNDTRKTSSNEIDFREVYEGFVEEESVQGYKSMLYFQF